MHRNAGIPEDKVAGLLARAAELDRQRISVDALRSAALEAGINAAAVDQAIAEYEAGINRVPAPRDVAAEKPGRGWRGWLRNAWPVAKLAALGLALGMFGGMEDGLIALSLTATCGLTIFLARRARADEATDFQLKTTVLTITLAVGFHLVAADGEISGLLMFVGILQLLLGSLFIVTRNSEAEEAPAAEF
jgi:hypothetical protein